MTPPRDASRPIVVLRLTDGRAGHESMTRGLVQALARRAAVRERAQRATMASALIGAPGPAAGEAPDLVLGAGRRTHLPTLLLARRHRARSVVLLAPSVPAAWFDLCLIPRHDRAPARPNVVETDGVLNRARPGRKDPTRGLLLIGGPSAHHSWLERELCTQVESIADRAPAMRWEIATSRRTPPSTVARLGGLDRPNLTLHPVDRVGTDWLPDALARAAQAWVSEDSVSMIYEALTAGAATGILRVPRRGPGRVVRAVTDLLVAGTVVPFNPAGNPAPVPAPPLAEADRCAELIVARFLPDRDRTG